MFASGEATLNRELPAAAGPHRRRAAGRARPRPGRRPHRQPADPHRPLPVQLAALDRAGRYGRPRDHRQAVRRVAREGRGPRRQRPAGAQHHARGPAAEPPHRHRGRSNRRPPHETHEHEEDRLPSCSRPGSSPAWPCWCCALLVWFFGPLAGSGIYFPLEPVFPRAVLIGVLVLVWLAAELAPHQQGARARAQDGRQPRQPAAAARPGPDSPPPRRSPLLGTRLRDALSTLRASPAASAGISRGTYLYDLPWYMFIGPPGAGKTTALVNSGLNFPLADAKGGADRRASAAPATATGGSPTRPC